jgi:hypothetical protein
MSHPSFMIGSNPEPLLRQRKFNGRMLQVWVGKVEVGKIQGWPDNPRIDIARRARLNALGRQELTQDELLDLMREEGSFKLKELSADIIKNGLQRPLILSFSGRLLDGNRRFFAIRSALESIPLTDPNRRDLESVDALVLSRDTSDADVHDVLVETNFSPSHKLEWSDYVKAKEVIRLHEEARLSEDQIAKALNWAKTKVRETIRIHELIQDFLAFATQSTVPGEDSASGLGLNEIEAEKMAAERYQFFNEAQKSFWNDLRSDYDFKLMFFRWVASGVFGSFGEVRVARRAYDMPEARAELDKRQPGSGKIAKAIVDYNDRVVRSGDEAGARIKSFVEFLRKLDAETIAKLSHESVQDLGIVADQVKKMREAVQA